MASYIAYRCCGWRGLCTPLKRQIPILISGDWFPIEVKIDLYKGIRSPHRGSKMTPIEVKNDLIKGIRSPQDGQK